MEQRGLATSPVSSGGTPARENGSKFGNAALPVLDNGQGGDAEVEEALAELLVSWLGRRRGGAAGKTHRSAAELVEAMADRNGRLWWSGCRV